MLVSSLPKRKIEVKPMSHGVHCRPSRLIMSKCESPAMFVYIAASFPTKRLTGYLKLFLLNCGLKYLYAVQFEKIKQKQTVESITIAKQLKV